MNEQRMELHQVTPPDRKRPKCDQCDEPAIMSAVDVLRREVPADMWATFEPFGKPRLGCADHPVRSVEFVTELPPGGQP